MMDTYPLVLTQCSTKRPGPMASVPNGRSSPPHAAAVELAAAVATAATTAKQLL